MCRVHFSSNPHIPVIITLHTHHIFSLRFVK